MGKKKKKLAKKKGYKKRKKKSLSNKLDKVLKEEEKILKQEKRIEAIESKTAKERKDLEKIEIEEAKRLAQLQALEKEIMNTVTPHPLTKITHRDFSKALVGATFGVVAHFSFLEGLHISEHFSITRATSLYLASFLIGFLMLYFSGFRRIKQIRMMHFIPARLMVIYFTSIIVIVIVLLLFGQLSFSTPFADAYVKVSAISLIAILGAGAADLIGPTE